MEPDVYAALTYSLEVLDGAGVYAAMTYSLEVLDGAGRVRGDDVLT